MNFGSILQRLWHKIGLLDSLLHRWVEVKNDGRVLIPANLRKELGMADGDIVTLAVENGELRISTLKKNLQEVQRLMAKYKQPGISVVDELIAERRAEAAREMRSQDDCANNA